MVEQNQCESCGSYEDDIRERVHDGKKYMLCLSCKKTWAKYATICKNTNALAATQNMTQ